MLDHLTPDEAWSFLTTEQKRQVLEAAAKFEDICREVGNNTFSAPLSTVFAKRKTNAD